MYFPCPQLLMQKLGAIWNYFKNLSPEKKDWVSPSLFYPHATEVLTYV